MLQNSSIPNWDTRSGNLFTSLQHSLQRFWTKKWVIVADLDQCRHWKPAVFHQFFAEGKWNHVVGSAMQDDRSRLDGTRRSPSLPARAEQNELRRAAIDVHGHGSAPGLADDNLWLVLVEFFLGNANRFIEIVIIQFGLDDLVAMLGQKRRLGAARDCVPAVEKEDFHGAIVLAG